MGEKYEVTQFTPFAKHLGKLVAKDNGFSFKETKALISVRQIKKYIRERAYKDPQDTKRIFVDDKIVEDICNDIHNHMIGFDMTKAAVKGMLDMYWDDDTNTMMFRTPEEDIKKLEGPEDR